MISFISPFYNIGTIFDKLNSIDTFLVEVKSTNPESSIYLSSVQNNRRN